MGERWIPLDEVEATDPLAQGAELDEGFVVCDRIFQESAKIVNSTQLPSAAQEVRLEKLLNSLLKAEARE